MLHSLKTENAGDLALILVTVVFITSRLMMPLVIDGSYVDEYWHITSGISLFESGNLTYFYNNGSPYNRGLLMSLWVGLWMALLGKSLLVAKLAPISVGIINYFLLLYLSLKVVEKKRYQILIILLYTVSPWCIFNDFYIRMYVVYELFLLMLLVFGYKIYLALRDHDWKKTTVFLLLVIALNILNLISNTDSGKYLLSIASAVMLATLFIFEFDISTIKCTGLVSRITGNTFLSTKGYRAAIVLIIVLLSVYFLDVGDKFKYLLDAELKYTSAPDHKYTWLFWEKNGVITVFFVLAVSSFWLKNSGFEKALLLVGGTLFFIHILSSDDLQIIRGVMYFMPIYYFTAVIGISKVKYPSDSLWYAVISSIFLLTTMTNAPRGFYTAPRIDSEIFYIEYSRLYDAVINNCRDKFIIEASPLSPFVARFHGVNVDYVLSVAGNADEDDLYTIDKNTGKLSTVWGGTPVITDIGELKALDKDICLVVRVPSMKRFLSSGAIEMLKNAKRSWHFSYIDLYIFKR